MKKYIENIKALRKERHITQTQLADAIDIARSTVGHWETERSTPSIDEIIKLANYFDVSTDYLLGLSEVRNPKVLSNALEVFPYERQVIKAYRVLAPSQQEMVSRMLGIAYDVPVAREA